VALLAACGAPAPPVADLLLRNGRVLDGSGADWVWQDLAITGGRIADVGLSRVRPMPARDTVELHGLLVAPGFWDVHFAGDLRKPRAREALPLLYQGVTTVVDGADGSGVASVDSIFAEYQRLGIGINVLTYVGHNAARAAVMGDDFARPARPDEIAAMQRYVARGMAQGAFGLSSGLAYNPAFFATTDELVQLNRVAARYGGVFQVHDRDMGATLDGIGYLNSIREAITIAEQGGTPLILSHFQALGVTANRQMPEAIRLVEAARAA
jgi:N-acyl-D-amino-acid deacylase